MTSIIIAAVSYFFGALTVIMDKYLLRSEKISSPVIYAFYVGLLGMGVIIFWPLGLFFSGFRLEIPQTDVFELAMVSGFTFLAAITLLYFAVKKSEASKVTPLVYSIVPLVTFTFSSLFDQEKLSNGKLVGIFLLIVGGLLISFDLPLKFKKNKLFSGFYLSVLSGIFMGISLFLLKLVYNHENFYNGFFWSRAGAFLSCFLFLLVPSWRKSILKSFSNGKRNTNESVKTGGLFVANKILGGSSSALINFAIGLGSVTIVSSMISLQYVFVLIFAILAGKKMPHIFEERMKVSDQLQKIVAIIIITAGMYLIF